MEAKALADVLGTHPFVEGLPDEYVERMAAMSREVAFGRDEVIFHEGGRSDQFYLLFSGKVALEVSAPGRILRVETLAEGDELGWSSVLLKQTKHFQARSIEPVRALAFSGTQLREACESDAAFGYAIMVRLANLVAARLQATRLQLLDIYAPRGAKLI